MSFFNQEVKAGKEYFIVPLSSCGQCVDSALKHLAHDNLDWVVILSGQTEDSSRFKNLEITKANYFCFNDSESLISDYSVSIALPTLLTTNQKGDIVTKKEYHYGSWQ